MSRVQRRMYKRARGQAMLRRAALLFTAVMIIAGLAGRLRGGHDMSAKPLLKPTPTPVTLGFDETVTSREVALEKLTWYGLQTGIFSTKEAADAKAASFSDRGAPGYVYQDGEKYRVLIACYGEESDAATVRDRLARQQEVDVYLHRWTLPALTLRLSGMAGQLDVAEAGLHLVRQSAAQLRDCAIAADRGESGLSGAQATLKQMDESFRLWQETARRRFSKPYPMLIDELLSLADAWGTHYASMTGASRDITALSASMKIHAMTMYTQLAQLHHHLESQ